MTDEKEEIKFVYQGIRAFPASRKSTKLVKHYQYAELTQEGLSSTPLLFSKPLCKIHVSPGAVMQGNVTRSGEHFTVHGEMNFLNYYEDKALVEEWAVRSKAEQTHLEIDADIRKLAGYDAAEALLAPIKKHYGKLNQAQRRAFLAYMLSSLNG